MLKISDILAAIGVKPRTLDQASQPLGQSQAALGEVVALFTAAGLDLDAMRAAGPDSLKAHIEAVSAKDAELAAATERLAALSSEKQDADDALAVALEDLARADSMFAAVGFEFTAESKPEDFAAAFQSHVKQAAAVSLAKTGTPPVAAVAPEEIATPPAFRNDAERWAHYAALRAKNPAAAQAFYDAHIKRAR